ncbi:MAG: prepilin-type N-terminal cleavage/methylation domain-containing protein [Burkholderiaceae bacterium]|nr:prepilin-type N-terminal cleavage/methylation domain-containing protein [Burkholderiaceae bacterium]
MKRYIPTVERGFTLLELLVAITVLAVVSMIAWRGLNSLVSTRERLEPEVDEVRSLLTTFGQMERDLTQVPNPVFLGLTTSPLNVRIVDGDHLIELARVAGTSLDRATEVQTVFYRIVDGTLVRQATPPLPAFDRANVENFETARLLNNVRSMSVRVWQVPTGWVSPFASEAGTVAQTPAVPGAPTLAPALPTAPPGIEVTLSRTDGKIFRRVFLVGA